MSRYDDIGTAYAVHRRPDPRIAARIAAALGGAERIVNVGAGTGSYEPTDRFVVAVEPSAVMIAQRRVESSPVVQAVAESLPFDDATFDAALAVLTIHHWTDKARGLAEMRRVACRRVLFGFDVSMGDQFWVLRDYWPEIRDLDISTAPTVDEVVNALAPARVEVVPVPWDCTDGFLGAYWRRPSAYLDPSVRSCISGFAAIPAEAVERGVERLRADLQSGEWERRNGELLGRDEFDLGMRLVIS